MKKKNLTTRYGTIKTSKHHILAKSAGKSLTSRYMQEVICFTGQSCGSFESASEVFDHLLNKKIHPKSIERTCHFWGQKMLDQQNEAIESEEFRVIDKRKAEETVCIQMDGGMFLTRLLENNWKELKLARIFPCKSVLKRDKNSNFIDESTYVVHYGNVAGFRSKLDYEIENFKNKVFISDGAPWIWNHVDDHYPNAVQILDYFHAVQHLHEFANEYFETEAEIKEWTNALKDNILAGETSKVIQIITELPERKKVKQKQQALIKYYQKNITRMQYKSFLEQGYCIGSGAIESAIKAVLQQRLKQPGQRWSISGLEQMAQLRVIYKSNRWELIVNECKIAA
jgi:hypothetical protein